MDTELQVVKDKIQKMIDKGYNEIYKEKDGYKRDLMICNKENLDTIRYLLGKQAVLS